MGGAVIENYEGVDPLFEGRRKWRGIRSGTDKNITRQSLSNIKNPSRFPCVWVTLDPWQKKCRL
jgi:hypothetical protein